MNQETKETNGVGVTQEDTLHYSYKYIMTHYDHLFKSITLLYSGLKIALNSR